MRISTHKMRNKLIGFKLLLLFLIFEKSNVEAQAPANMTISLSTLGACGANLKTGDSCVFEMVIQVPASTATMMHVELFTSDNSTTTMAQICKPTIIIGQNYNITSAPIPELTSSNGNFQFDQAIIDFGVIVNTGSTSTPDANSIKIRFLVVIIENSQPTGTSIWITAGAEYYNGDEIWIGQTSLSYDSQPITGTPAPTLLKDANAFSSATVEIGKFSTFDAKLTIQSPVVTSVSLAATSNDLSNSSLTVCSIHIKSAGWCFNCIDSTKAYLPSKYSKEQNLVTFDLGKIVNIGVNNASQSANSFIEILVAYKVSANAKASETSTITLKATVNSVLSTFIHTVNVIEASGPTLASIPTINPLVSTVPVSIYQAFNITLVIDFPTSYNNYLEVEAIPNQDTSDGKPRAKICSVVVTSSGENLPCPKCMNTGVLSAISQNSSLYSTNDGITWSIGSVMNYNLRSITDKLDVNKMTLSIIGQILDHPSNTQGSNVSIPIGVTFGNQTIWVTEYNVIVGGSANYSNVNESLPNFSISLADSGTYDTKVKEPRAIYFDIYTKPGSVYRAMDVEVVMPETLIGSNIPAATVCSVKVHYVGMYSVCAQQSFINNIENGKISYLQRMVNFKNDKAIVKLDPLCNSADSSVNMDPIDGLVRLLIYFQLDDDPNVPTSNKISVGTKYTLDQIYIGTITFTKTASLPTSPASAGLIHAFTNESTLTTTGGIFSTANYIIKIPPSSLFGYNFEASLTNSLTQGKVAFCSIRITRQGANVPCSNIIKHSFSYTSDLIKNYDFATAGPICSINNLTSAVNTSNSWDEDSVNVQIITRPSLSATGTYQVSLNMKDQFSNSSLKTETFSWTSTAGTPSPITPNFTLTNSSIFGVDPTEKRHVLVNSNYLDFYKGQTSIIRFNLTINEPKYFDISFTISSALSVDQFEILRFFVLDVGANFPCSSVNSFTYYTNGSLYPSSIKIDIGDLAYFPQEPSNLTASAITVEAHVRIPLSSVASGSASFNVAPTLSTNQYTELTKTLTGPIKDPNSFIGNTSDHSIDFSQIGTESVAVRESVILNISLKISSNSNSRAILNFSCIDEFTNRQFCHISQVSIISIGKNVDGFSNEYKNNLIPVKYSKQAGVAYFYDDTAVLDLGIITNTNYGQKIGNYDATLDDYINLQATILIIDDQISDANKLFNFIAEANLNELIISSGKNLTITRTNSERPFLIYNVSFVDYTNTNTLNSNAQVTIKVEIEHANNSTAEAYNTKVLFFLPKYVTFDNLIQVLNVNSTFSHSLNDSTIIFHLDRLHFNQKVTFTFRATFDQLSKYNTFIDQFAKQPPSLLKLPFNIVYEKYQRAGDTTTKFNTNFDYLQFKPPSVTITSVPLTSIKSQLTEQCRITSSAEGSIPTSPTFEWKIGYRSHYWLISHGTYITISFFDQVKISRIIFNQLANSVSNTRLSKYRIGFSEDNVAFAHLPEVSTASALGDSFTFDSPNKFIQCRYLRIYITDVAQRSDLETKTTGLIINDILGEFVKTTFTCPTSTISALYKPRSYLYVSYTTSLFVCDETVDRSTSECYSSSDSTSGSWTVLPKTVSTVVFYIKDKNSGAQYLYGIGKDKKSFVRSDDNGITWKVVSPREFNTMDTNRISLMYEASYYTPLTIYSTVETSLGLWKFTVKGVYYNSILKFDWYN